MLGELLGENNDDELKEFWFFERVLIFNLKLIPITILIIYVIPTQSYAITRCTPRCRSLFGDKSY